MIEFTPYKTCRIEKVKYGIEEADYTVLSVTMDTEYTDYGLRMHLTNMGKVVVDEFGDRCAGAKGPNRVYFIDEGHHAEAQALMGEAISIMNGITQAQGNSVVFDLADLDYRLMLLVGKIFKYWSNIKLPESIEEVLEFHEEAAQDQYKREQEVAHNGG